VRDQACLHRTHLIGLLLYEDYNHGSVYHDVPDSRYGYDPSGDLGVLLYSNADTSNSRPNSMVRGLGRNNRGRAWSCLGGHDGPNME